MSEREKRAASSARPGDIVKNAKQKRRTRDEIDRDNLEIEKKREEKERVAAAKKKEGIRRVALAEDKIRQNDEHARSSAARPDLVTAQLKRTVAAQSESQPEEVEVNARALLYSC